MPLDGKEGEAMSVSVQFAHAIGDEIEIVHVKGICGVVTVLRMSERGAYYLIVWWQDGHRYEEWLAEFEIKAKEKR